ncbi:MAG: polysaccharide deacetylase family protein [Acetobacteraceae bacterium]
MIKNPIPWPAGNRCAVALTWDVDADSGLNYVHPDSADTLVAAQSLVRYGPTIAVPRLIDVLKRLDLRQTFFVPGWVIERYPATVDLILEKGHEVGLHGYVHERSNELSRDEEEYTLGRAVDAYVRKIGRRPRGWRAPAFAFSKHSLELLIGAGLEYDSSLMGNDIPYLLQGAAGELLELPTDWTFDDWPQYMHNRDFNVTMPVASPARAMELFRAEFDATWEYGALWITVWHPFLSGRLARLRAIIELLQYMRARGGVWFARLDEVSDHVRSLREAGSWRPDADWIRRYDSPIPELDRRRHDASVVT